jgi:hypothetical protein
VAEVLQTETDASDAQSQAIKQQERSLKIRKAQLKANKALHDLNIVRAKA